MRSRHRIDSQETQAVINKSSVFSFRRRCSTLEKFLLFKPNKLKLLEKSDEIILYYI
jgi:hypothetical protein